MQQNIRLYVLFGETTICMGKESSWLQYVALYADKKNNSLMPTRKSFPNDVWEETGSVGGGCLHGFFGSTVPDLGKFLQSVNDEG